MKAIDTTILIRFLTGDDQSQSEKVYALFKKAESEKTELFVPLLIVLEMIWVLESVYEVSRTEILDAISDLLLMPVLKFDQHVFLQKLIRSAQANTFDLSDLLIAYAANTSGCEKVVTFDKDAAKFNFFELLR
ncbi:MAG: type II toxin-antitoxin system VapC family toxin [Desulfobacterales bacterium]|jgi:predicted nucleic-acid-binding protein|nr:type II toxin-antitoxin system VapC family toxin [Desulfobacterales bacterium]